MLHYNNKALINVATEYLDKEVYAKMKELSIHSGWDPTIHQGYFIISIDKINQAEAVLGRKIEVTETDARAIINCCKPLKVELDASVIKKGKGEIMVTEAIEKFIVTTYDKGNAQKHEVPRSLVKTMWETIKEYPKDEYVDCRRVARNVLKQLGIKEFNTTADKWESFNWRYFIGHRSKEGVGKGYFTYYYNPLKCIQALGLVKHFNGGTIRRVGDSYDFDQCQLIQKCFATTESKALDQKAIGWKPPKKPKKTKGVV